MVVDLVKKITKLLKKIIFSILVLYGYNVIAVPLKIIIPINYITVGSMTIFGVPSLFAFITIYYLIY